MQCNSMLHFGRDEGVEMAAAYHGVISTVRQRGSELGISLVNILKIFLMIVRTLLISYPRI